MPPQDDKTRQRTTPYAPDADTSPPVPDRTQPGGEYGGLRFGPPAVGGEIGTLGRFRIKKELGRGGMGAVFLALDTRLERQVALKVMLPQAAVNQTAKDRFVREARAAARISHDNVIAILDADEIDGVPCIALPFLQGYPLDQYLKKKGNPAIPQVLRIGREIALGLGAAHDLGIVHRDVKPGNVWLEAPNGRVKLLDFGLAKPQDEEAGGKELTHSGAVMGTPAYMAPEQAAGHKVDHRADLYSLGTVLYRLVVGKTPFERPGGMMALLTALAVEPPPRVEDFNADVPPALAELIHQLLEKNRDLRPLSAKDVAKRLAAIRDNPGVAGADVSLAPISTAMQPQAAYVQVPVSAAPASAFADIDADEPTERSMRVAPIPNGTAPRRATLFAAIGASLLALAAGGYFVAKMLSGSKKPEEVVEKKSDKKPDKPTTEIANPAPGVVRSSPVVPGPTPGEIEYVPWQPVTNLIATSEPRRGPLDDLDPAKMPDAKRLNRPKELVTIVEGAASRDFAPAIGDGLVTAYPPTAIRLWTAREGTFQPEAEKDLLGANANSFHRAAASPDGMAVAGLVNRQRLVVFKVIGTSLWPLTESNHGNVFQYAWAPDSKSIYLVNHRNILYRWNPHETDSLGEKLLDLGYAPTARFGQLQVAPNGQSLALASDRGVELIDLSDPASPRRTKLTFNSTATNWIFNETLYMNLGAIAFSSGNRFLYVPIGTKLLRVDLTSPTLTAETVIDRGTNGVGSVLVSPDGRTIVTSRTFQFVGLDWWDANEVPFKRLGSWDNVEPVGIGFAPDGRHLMVEQNGDACVLRLNAIDGAPAPAPPPAPTPPDPPPPKPVPKPVAKWVELTDGKTLAAWDQFQTDGWAMKNGILGADGRAQGWVGTKKEYGDFEFEFEFRLPPKGNSGVFLRAWENGQPSGAEFVEIQLLDNAAYLPVTAPNTRHGAVFKKVAPDPAPPLRLIQWTKAKVEVVGKHVAVTIGGVKCIDADVDFPRMSGRVGLQQYRTGVEFRNVRIREK